MNDLLFPLALLVASFLIECFAAYLIRYHALIGRVLAGIATATITFGSASLLLLAPDNWTLVIAITGLFRVLNNGRAMLYRIHPKALERKYTRSVISLAAISATVSSFFYFIDDLIVVLLSAAALLSVSFLVTTYLSILRWRQRQRSIVSSKDLPTVSVCIPARNETQDLPECIESVLDSKYPKLEILVLDDCSHDKTPDVIKKYAHSGVRFLSGSEPEKDWVAKNLAMNKLFDESRGEVVIFMGVDVRMEKDSIHQIIAELGSHNDMVSILPRRHPHRELSLFIQPLRYWWELAIPRVRGRRPPVLSTCWAIRRARFQKLGDFESVRQSVQPERHFAKRLGKAYRFLLAGQSLGLVSNKHARDQYDTALRVRYPQLQQRPEVALLAIAAELLLLLMPLFGYLQGLTALSILIVISLASANALISSLSVRYTWPLGFITYPIVLLEDMYLITRSMIAYEYGVVTWKERNICLPMLQVEKHLPKY